MAYSIAVVGAGNLAASVVPALKRSGIDVTRIYSRNVEHATTLAERVGAMAAREIADLEIADFYLLSVPDNCIAEIAAVVGTIADNDSVVLHTSGSVDINVLKPYCANYGVFYPFQTFSASKPITDFSSVPVYIEANSESVMMKLKKLAESVSPNVLALDSEQRMGLHIAGVFSCNFVTGLLSCAFDICTRFGIDFCDIKPLVEMTIKNVFDSGNPDSVQTGPAARQDTDVMSKHFDFLQSNNGLAAIYATMSGYIMSKHK
jgi:predicted short-subunit dehydrogenase-like oxidoreductase (DUF2520 family)